MAGNGGQSLKILGMDRVVEMHRRYINNEASQGELARSAGIHVTTLKRLFSVAGLAKKRNIPRGSNQEKPFIYRGPHEHVYPSDGGNACLLCDRKRRVR